MKKVIAFLMSAAMVLGLAGCASTSSSQSQSASTKSTSNVKTITIGIGNIVAPQFYVDKSGNLVGYDVDVLKEVNKLLPQCQFKFEQMEFSSLLVSLEAGKIDIADFQLNKTAEREKTYLFPDEEYDISDTVLVVSGDKKNIKGFSDMADMKIAQMPTSNFYSMVQTYNQQHTNAAVKLQAIDSLPVADAFQMITDGRIDGTLCLKSTYTELQKTMKLNLRVAGSVDKSPVYWILQKNAGALKKDLDQAVATLKKNGTLSKISVKWYGEDTSSKE